MHFLLSDVLQLLHHKSLESNHCFTLKMDTSTSSCFYWPQLVTNIAMPL